MAAESGVSPLLDTSSVYQQLSLKHPLPYPGGLNQPALENHRHLLLYEAFVLLLSLALFIYYCGYINIFAEFHCVDSELM